MDAAQGELFLRSLGAKQIRVRGDWITASCVLARWTHQKGTDTNPSFAIKIGERSYFTCFVCRSGSLEELLQSIEMYAKDDIKGKYDFLTCHKLLAEEVSVLPLTEYTEFPPKEKMFEEFPTWWLESFIPVAYAAVAVEYLKFRGVMLTQAQKHNFKYDTKAQRIVAPYYNVFGKLAGARGRSILPEASGSQKHFDYSWNGYNNSRLVWFNEQALNLTGAVVAVEGVFDALRVEQVHPKVVANLMAKPVSAKMVKLADSPLVIQIPDRDQAGEDSVKLYYNMCLKYGIKYKTLWLDEGVKDPAECSSAYLAEKINELLI